MTQEFIHEFKGYGRFPSRCTVKIFSDDGEHFICLEDIDEGTSVTNATEQLAAEIVNKMNYNPWNCRFFETYKQYQYDSFDEVEYDWWPEGENWMAKNPKWSPAPEEYKELFTS